MNDWLNKESYNSLTSIIVPTYNFADHITPTIKSILNQTYSNFELIIVDDGSTDNTREVIELFKDSRIHYYWKENGGGASARNFGIEKAKGGYIAFCDHDDIWLTEKLEIQVDFMNENKNIGLSLVGCSILNSDLQEISSFTQGTEIPLKDILLQELPITFSQMMFRTATLIKLGLLNSSYKLCDDYDLLIRAIRTIKVGYLSNKLVKSIKHSDSASNNLLQLSKEISEIKLAHLATIKKNDPRLPKKDRKKIKSQTYFKIAKCAFFINRRGEAVKNFFRSIIASPTNFEAYLFIPFCLIGPRFFELLIPLYEKIFRRKYIKYL